jgi:hypothetical protein
MWRDSITLQYVLGASFLSAAIAGVAAAATSSPTQIIPGSGKMIDPRTRHAEFSRSTPIGDQARPLVNIHGRDLLTSSTWPFVIAIETATKAQIATHEFEMPSEIVQPISCDVPANGHVVEPIRLDSEAIVGLIAERRDDLMVRLLTDLNVHELFDNEGHVARPAADIDHDDVLDANKLCSARNYFVDEIWNTPGGWREDAITNLNRYCDIRGRIAAVKSQPSMRNSRILIASALFGILTLASLCSTCSSSTTPGVAGDMLSARPAQFESWAFIANPRWPYSTPIGVVLIDARWPMQRAALRSESQSKYPARLRCA